MRLFAGVIPTHSLPTEPASKLTPAAGHLLNDKLKGPSAWGFLQSTSYSLNLPTVEQAKLQIIACKLNSWLAASLACSAVTAQSCPCRAVWSVLSRSELVLQSHHHP